MEANAQASVNLRRITLDRSYLAENFRASFSKRLREEIAGKLAQRLGKVSQTADEELQTIRDQEREKLQRREKEEQLMNKEREMLQETAYMDDLTNAEKVVRAERRDRSGSGRRNEAGVPESLFLDVTSIQRRFDEVKDAFEHPNDLEEVMRISELDYEKLSKHLLKVTLRIGKNVFSFELEPKENASIEFQVPMPKKKRDEILKKFREKYGDEIEKISGAELEALSKGDEKLWLKYRERQEKLLEEFKKEFEVKIPLRIRHYNEKGEVVVTEVQITPDDIGPGLQSALVKVEVENGKIKVVGANSGKVYFSQSVHVSEKKLAQTSAPANQAKSSRITPEPEATRPKSVSIEASEHSEESFKEAEEEHKTSEEKAGPESKDKDEERETVAKTDEDKEVESKVRKGVDLGESKGKDDRTHRTGTAVDSATVLEADDVAEDIEKASEESDEALQSESGSEKKSFARLGSELEVLAEQINSVLADKLSSNLSHFVAVIKEDKQISGSEVLLDIASRLTELQHRTALEMLKRDEEFKKAVDKLEENEKIQIVSSLTERIFRETLREVDSFIEAHVSVQLDAPPEALRIDEKALEEFSANLSKTTFNIVSEFKREVLQRARLAKSKKDRSFIKTAGKTGLAGLDELVDELESKVMEGGIVTNDEDPYEKIFPDDFYRNDLTEDDFNVNFDEDDSMEMEL